MVAPARAWEFKSPPGHKVNKKIITITILAVVAVTLGGSYFFAHKEIALTPQIALADNNIAVYNGPVRHIFFHSLIVYPDLANADIKNAAGYAANMITVDQFVTFFFIV